MLHRWFFYRARSTHRNTFALAAALLLLPTSAAQSQPCFDEGTTYATRATANTPIRVIACDVNNDQRQDLIAVHDPDDALAILLGTDAGFDSYLPLPIDTDPVILLEPVDVACCDLDADGLMDLVTANHSSDDISVVYNDGVVAGDVLWSMPQRYPVGIAPWAVQCRNLDQDAYPDVVTANLTSNSVSVLRNAGNGALLPAQPYAVAGGPRSLDLCDIDGDTDLDIVTANFSGASVTVLANNGSAAFTPIGTYTLTSQPFNVAPFAVACCDLDGVDGPDVVTANIVSDSLAVLYNEGNGTLIAPDYIKGVDGPTALACADWNGDGQMDIASANLTGDDSALFLNEGAGGLAAPTFFPSMPTASSIIAMVLPGDTGLGLTVAFAAGVKVLRNDCGAAPDPDSDGDGDVDLIDFAAFQTCFGDAALLPPCAGFDSNGDQIIGAADFAWFQSVAGEPQ